MASELILTAKMIDVYGRSYNIPIEYKDYFIECNYNWGQTEEQHAVNLLEEFLEYKIECKIE